MIRESMLVLAVAGTSWQLLVSATGRTHQQLRQISNLAAAQRDHMYMRSRRVAYSIHTVLLQTMTCDLPESFSSDIQVLVCVVASQSGVSACVMKVYMPSGWKEH